MAAKAARFTLTAAAALIGACTSPVNGATTDASTSGSGEAVDDGTYLSRIDPLGGQWRVGRLGGADLSAYKAWVNFSEGGFLNHGAGCSGGHPAFYRLEGNRMAVTRLESARIGKCASAPGRERAAAVESERRLTAFLDGVSTWERVNDRTLILSTASGARAVLTRPVEPHPELAGRWLIETIGGKPLVTEKRPPTVVIEMGTIGAHADCNSLGGPFTISSPGRIVVNGPMMSTLIGCRPEDAAEDETIRRAVVSATSYRLRGGVLTFTGGPGMVLRRPPAPDRRLRGEYASCGNTLLGAYQEGPILLTVGGSTMRDNAGCSAGYGAEGPRLNLSLAKGRACAATAPKYEPGKPVPIGGAMSLLANATPDGFGFDDQGRLRLRTGRGLLTMCRKGSPPPFGS